MSESQQLCGMILFVGGQNHLLEDGRIPLFYIYSSHWMDGCTKR